MKTKKTILLLLLLIFSAICNARAADSLTIRKDSLQICVKNSGTVFSLLYEVKNRSNNTYYLWIERNVHSTNRERIRDYFLTMGEHFNLAQMAIETNVIWRCRSIYGSFVKKIKPQERFTIQILSDERFSECEKKRVFRYLDEHVVIVSENMLRHYLPISESFFSYFFYKHSFITIPVNMLDFTDWRKFPNLCL